MRVDASTASKLGGSKTSTDSRDTEFGLGLTSRSHVLSLLHRVGAVLPVPPLVIGTTVFQVGLIAAYLQANLVAKGHQLAAAAVGRGVATAMLVASAYVLMAVSIAMVRVVGEIALKHITQRQVKAQRVVVEFDRYREQEERLRVLADAVKRERDGTGFKLAS